MTYHLDTSIVRSHGKKLILLPPGIDVQTNYLAIMEVITGIPLECSDPTKCERNFQSRRSSINYLLSSSITINETWVDDIIDRAFRYSRNGHDSLYFSDAIRKLINLASRTNSYDTFISKLDSLNLRNELKDLQAFDEHTSKSFSSTSYQLIKDSLNHPSANFPSKSPPKSLSDIRDYLNSPDGFELNYSMALCALCGRVLGGEPTEEVYSNYNHELDIFLFVWAISGMEAIAKQYTYGRNDGIDLLHLIYVREGDTFVTDDNKIRELAKLANLIKDVSIRSISSEEFFGELLP